VESHPQMRITLPVQRAILKAIRAGVGFGSGTKTISGVALQSVFLQCDWQLENSPRKEHHSSRVGFECSQDYPSTTIYLHGIGRNTLGHSV